MINDQEANRAGERVGVCDFRGEASQMGDTEWTAKGNEEVSRQERAGSVPGGEEQRERPAWLGCREGGRALDTRAHVQKEVGAEVTAPGTLVPRRAG